MQKLKFFEGNLNPKVRSLSSATTAIFLCLVGILLLLIAFLAWLGVAIPRSSPPYPAWTGQEMVWGFVGTLSGIGLLVGAWTHSRVFGHKSYRFISSARHSDVVRDVGAWLESRPYHSATLLLQTATEVDSVYQLQIVEPRSKDNGLLQSLSRRPPALPEAVVRST